MKFYNGRDYIFVEKIQNSSLEDQVSLTIKDTDPFYGYEAEFCLDLKEAKKLANYLLELTKDA